MIANPKYPVPDELDDPKLRKLFDYWLSKFREVGLPSRKDIDPLDIWPLMGHLNIIYVVQEGERVRYRYRL